MTFKSLALAAAALAIALPAAEAADIGASGGVATAIVVPAAMDWTGLYAGLHVGFGTGRTGPNQFGDDGTHRFSGILAGAQFGWNYQFANRLVAGFEASLAGASLSGSNVVDIAPPPFGVQSEGTTAKLIATIGPRLGYALDRALIYAKGGFAALSHSAWFRDDRGRISATNWRGGWFVGAGVEYAFAPNWTVKAEYNYLNFGNGNWTFGFTDFQRKIDVHTFTVGVNYLFTTGAAPAAVIARY